MHGANVAWDTWLQSYMHYVRLLKSKSPVLRGTYIWVDMHRHALQNRHITQSCIWNCVYAPNLNVNRRPDKTLRFCAIFSDWTIETPGIADEHLVVSFFHAIFMKCTSALFVVQHLGTTVEKQKEITRQSPQRNPTSLLKIKEEQHFNHIWIKQHRYRARVTVEILF